MCHGEDAEVLPGMSFRHWIEDDVMHMHIQLKQSHAVRKYLDTADNML